MTETRPHRPHRPTTPDVPAIPGEPRVDALQLQPNNTVPQPISANFPDAGMSGAEQAALLEDALFQIKRVVVGQDRLVERVLLCLLANGHCLIEGVPGLAKTLTVSTLSDVVGGQYSRIQFTPDLVPADLVGTRIWRPSAEEFDVEWGPVFANIVLADEINRAPAKVQSALLESMAERQVTVGGQTRRLPEPFLVLATQNPIESEGVYALPEAQRDRFLMHVVVPQPTYEEETAIASRMSTSTPRAEQVLTLEQLLGLQDVVRNTFVHHAVQDYAVRLVMTTREPARWGSGGPRTARRPGLEPARDARSHHVGPGVGRSARAPLRRAAGRLRRRARGPPPPDHGDLRRAGRGHALRRHPAPRAPTRPGSADRAAAGRAAHPADRRVRPDADPGRRMSQPQRPGATSASEVASRASVLRRLELEIRRRLDGSAAGDHLTSAMGPGTERAGAREYQAGDDARLIDWNLTARMASTHVRTTEAEREFDTWIVADRSASLDFGTARTEKRDVVLGAAAAFGLLTARGQNRIGLVVAGTDVPQLAAAAKWPHLSDGRPRGHPRHPPARRRPRRRLRSRGGRCVACWWRGSAGARSWSSPTSSTRTAGPSS